VGLNSSIRLLITNQPLDVVGCRAEAIDVARSPHSRRQALLPIVSKQAQLTVGVFPEVADFFLAFPCTRSMAAHELAPAMQLDAETPSSEAIGQACSLPVGSLT